MFGTGLRRRIDAREAVRPEMPKLAPWRGPDRSFMFTIFVAEMIVLGQQLPVRHANLEKVVDGLVVRDARPAVRVRLGVRRKVFKHIPADQHEAGADVLDLKGLIRAGHLVTVQRVQVKDARQRGEVLVAQHRTLTYPIPVHALHWHRSADDALVGLDHQGDVVRPETLVGVDEHQVGGVVDCKEVVGDGVAPTLDQALIAEKDARQLDAVLHARLFERQKALRVLRAHHAPVAGRANDEVHQSSPD